MISFIIPSYNNLNHLKNCYDSILRNAPDAEVVFLDDGSTDGTFEWMSSVTKGMPKMRSGKRVGHTILYDQGIRMATKPIVGILHADMIVGPNYIENILKHLKPKTVVCGTRVEPPLHPPGKEKIIQDFGTDFDNLKVEEFEKFCRMIQVTELDKTTRGMFAPWVIYKEDFITIGGHDPLFAPFPYEDSDIFQRWILAGYKLIQSRDALVYHLTCRGHRWTEQIGVDDNFYKEVSSKAQRNYIRKWGSWIKNDQFQHPIIIPKYDVGLVVQNCGMHALRELEPWCSTIYMEDDYDFIIPPYINSEQENTTYDLKSKIKSSVWNEKNNDIIITFDANKMTRQSWEILQNIGLIIKSSEFSISGGEYEVDIFKIKINKLVEIQDSLIVVKTPDIYMGIN